MDLFFFFTIVRELGDLRRFRLSLNTTLKAEPGNLQAIQLRAHTLYRGGFMQEAYDDIEVELSYSSAY